MNTTKIKFSGIIFVALMKQHVLNDKLLSYQWLGVIYNVVSVFLVGATAILNETETAADETITTTTTTGKALWGVLFVMAGAIVQAMQFVFEEKVMTMVRSYFSFLKFFPGSNFFFYLKSTILLWLLNFFCYAVLS